MIPNGQPGLGPGGVVSNSIPLGEPTSPFWSGIYGSLPGEMRASELTLVFLQLENSLLKRLLRLEATEGRLWKLVSRRRGGSGRRAVRQIELERQRVARELHTGVGQLLAAIRIQLEVMETEFPNPPPPVRQALLRIGTLASEALAQVRAVSRRLHAPDWQRLPIGAALQQLWDMSGVAQRFAGEVRIQPIDPDPDPDIKILLYRAAQEALANVMRHSHASRVDLALESRGKHLILTIQDNGVGFDTARVFSGPPDSSSGIGLRSILEYVIGLGGKLLVQSGPLGTKLEVSIPVQAESR